MAARAVALLSGGLDSMLAIRILQEQGVEIEALNFRTIFSCCQDDAGKAARDLGVRLTVISQEDDYLDLLRKPQHGYGRGANPCVDCRIYMFQRAAHFMEQVDAQFVISGEVVGQRPNSQMRLHLELIARRSGLDGRLLRPLSAKLLAPTLPETEGLVDRELLFDFHGRSRKELFALARQHGLNEIPQPSNGCALTESLFSLKVFDLMQHDPQAQRWDFELLKIGRHVRKDSRTKVILGRNEADNEKLDYMYRQPESNATVLLRAEGFPGPTGIVIGPADDAAIDFAVGVLLRYGKNYDGNDATVMIETRDGVSSRPVQSEQAINDAPLVTQGGIDQLRRYRERATAMKKSAAGDWGSETEETQRETSPAPPTVCEK
jgi:tRNA(Ile)-lysidine synthase TilS/MesJ